MSDFIINSQIYNNYDEDNIINFIINSQNYNNYDEDNIINFINIINYYINNNLNINDNLYINNNILEEVVDPLPPLNQDIITIDFVLETIDNDDLHCCICMETKENHNICQLNCQHKFCSECIITHVNRNRSNSVCPLCRTQITTITVQSNDDLYNLINI